MKMNIKGMTLVEVIISVMLFSVVALIASTVLISGATLALKSGDNTKVVGNASGVLENILGGAVIDIDEDSGEIRVEDTTEGIPDAWVTVGTGDLQIDDAASATIHFRGDAGTSEIIEGNFYRMDSESDRNETSLRIFVPE